MSKFMNPDLDIGKYVTVYAYKFLLLLLSLMQLIASIF